jgi:hypothetical protein
MLMKILKSSGCTCRNGYESIGPMDLPYEKDP